MCSFTLRNNLARGYLGKEFNTVKHEATHVGRNGSLVCRRNVMR